MNRMLATLKLRSLQARFGTLTYSECIELGQMAAGYLENMTVHDPAFGKFMADLRGYYEYAEIINHLNGLGKLDHAKAYSYLVCDHTTQKTEERMFHIPLYLRQEYERDNWVKTQVLDSMQHAERMRSNLEVTNVDY